MAYASRAKPAKFDHAVDTRYNTYACKEELKALPGGAWFEDGAWYVTEADFAEAMQIAQRAGLRKAGPVSTARRRSGSGFGRSGGRRCPYCGQGPRECDGGNGGHCSED